MRKFFLSLFIHITAAASAHTNKIDLPKDLYRRLKRANSIDNKLSIGFLYMPVETVSYMT